MSAEPFGQHVRVAAFLVLAAALGGLLVWGGTVAPDPAANNYPNHDDVGANPAAFVGERVVIGGTVVGTDPVVVRATYGVGGTVDVTLANADAEVAEGDHVAAFGTLADETTLDTERLLVRAPWETYYMYTVSFLGGVWVLGRIGRHWGLDRDRLAFVPRSERDG